MERLTGADATFLYTETPRAPFEIAALLVLDAGVGTAARGIEEYRETLASRLHLVPNFRRVVRAVPFNLDHPVFVDDPDFDLDYHVRRSALPKPGGKRELEELLGRLLSRPLDHARPLWEIYLIEGLEGDRVALFIKTHHALMDGVAGFNTIAAMVDLEAEPKETPEAQPWQPIPAPGAIGLLARASVASLRLPGQIAGAATGLVGNLIGSARPGQRSATEVLGASMAPPSPFNVILKGPRQVRFFGFPMAEVNAIREPVGAKVNDVALSLVGGAVRRYLERLDELPDKSLLTYMPIAVPSDGVGNSTTVIAARLRTDIADPIERLEAITSETAASKKRAIGAPQPVIMDIGRVTGPSVGAALEKLAVSVGLTQKLRLAGNVVTSNIAGIPVELFALGRRITHAYPVGVVSDGVGLNFTLLGYRDTLEFSMLSDAAAVPDPDVLLSDVHAEWKALKRAAKKR